MRVTPGRENQRLGGSAHNRASHEHQIERECGLACGRSACRRHILFGRIRLASQKRFIDVEVAGFDQPRVGRYEIASGEKNDIAGNNIRRRNVDCAAIAKHFGGKRHLLAQTLCSILGLALLCYVEDHGHEHDDRDNDEARNVAGERRYRRCEQQNQDQRIAQPSDESEQQAFAPSRVDPVRADRLEDSGGAGRTQAGACGMQPLEESGSGTAAKSDISGAADSPAS